METKTCTRCKETLHIESFTLVHRNKRKPDGSTRKTAIRNSRCKPCHAKYQREYYWRTGMHNGDKLRSPLHLKRTYGITYEDYERMLDEQKGVCAICLKPDKSGFALAVDHDHATGAIRSLLCTSCNGMLGFAQDDQTVLAKAIEYIKEHGGAV